ncbi:Ankyrin repeat and KH domain-containing protein mask [Colletotrichum fructicola Nara gc5]|uniref:Ankyrin repeat and KH domain-containing protein mask n=1 Tax=Colletotrichum fructicola (strain Nara gc5) TaxID=1213859 RepID=A0A7J6J7C6_COLFN|nr:Ankyrin repeat and KH domain-containing protein mask [Colletotrichum fructicola Nara gc5]
MPNLEEYTIGWICAINTEFVAARAFLDESHGKPEGVAQNDDNNYALGRMGQHNVVIAVLPKGEYGTTTAATVARNMVHSFPNVRVGLMVGIAGGAPSENHDIRLGDIVVSSRSGGKGGVFQYDYGKSMQNGSFVETGALNQPPQVLLAAVNGLESDYAMDGHQLDSKIEEALKRYPRLRKSHSRPPGISDRLYQPNVTHPPDSTSDCLQDCSDDPAQLVPRRQRSEFDDDPAIHFGLIASGNQVIKNAQIRDKLAADKGVLCFEMEAAGLMNHFPCLVVRGICDYSDTHKNKSWQGFASMVAAAYAKDLLAYDHITQGPERIALHFFFDFSDDRKQTLDNMLRALVLQLYVFQPKSIPELEDLFKRCNEGRDQPDSVALSDCLLRVFSGSPQTYVFLDALDECSERGRLLKWIKEFVAVPDLDHVKLIMTARPEAEFNQQIIPLIQDINCFSLQTESMNADIQSFVQSSLKERPGFEKWTSAPSTLQRISDEIGTKADGMFRWAACQLDSLESCIDHDEIVSILSCLPRTLNETYERILERIPNHRKDKSTRLLKFLVFSSRPFTLEAAVDIVAVRPQGFEIRDRMFIPRDILKPCPSLISIGKNAKTNRTSVQLAHFSVREYLLSAQDGFQKVSASVSILNTCIAYFWSVREAAIECAENLRSQNLGRSFMAESTAKIQIAQKFPLLEFVVLEWINLAHLTGEPDDIAEKAATILQDSRGYALWRDWKNPLETYRLAPWEQCGLYFACRKGLRRTARVLMLRNVDVDTRHGCMGALQGASSSGLQDIVEQLLARLSEFTAHEKVYGGALQLASQEGHVEVVKLLLSHGADTHSRKNEFCHHPALVGAAERGHREVVELLLDNGADINICDEYDDALSAASMNGFLETVEVLLKRGADVNIHSGEAIPRASRKGYDGIVKLLLDYGADVNAFSPDFGENAILSSLRNGHLNIATRLVNHGADVNVRSDDSILESFAWPWNTPLLIASARGYVDFTRLLLRHGADVNVQNQSGNALTAATLADQNRDEIIQLLLDNGAVLAIMSQGGIR